MSSDAAPQPTRQGTMEATAQAGVEFLKRNAADDLLAAQGLLDSNENGNAKNGNAATANGDAPVPTKQGTMETTAAEGADVIERLGGGVDADVKTRGQQAMLDDAKPADEAPTPTKTHTMAETTKEGEAFVGDAVDGDSKTRGQQKQLEELAAEGGEGAKKHKLGDDVECDCDDDDEEEEDDDDEDAEDETPKTKKAKVDE